MVNILNDKSEHIGKYISYMYRKGGAFISKELINEGIGSGQIMFLLQLYKNDGVTQERLSEIFNIDKGTTARALKKLEDGGFVIRLKDKIDKRAYSIHLTDKGIKTKAKIYKVLDGWDSKISENLTIDEKDTLLNLLKKVSKNTNMN